MERAARNAGNHQDGGRHDEHHRENHNCYYHRCGHRNGSPADLPRRKPAPVEQEPPAQVEFIDDIKPIEVPIFYC